MSQRFSLGVPGHSFSQVFRSPMHHAPIARVSTQLAYSASSPKCGKPSAKGEKKNKGLRLPLSRSSTFPATMLNSSSGDDVLSSAADAKAAARAKKTAAERIVLYVVLLT